MGGIGLAARVRGSGIEQSPSNSVHHKLFEIVDIDDPPQRIFITLRTDSTPQRIFMDKELTAAAFVFT